MTDTPKTTPDALAISRARIGQWLANDRQHPNGTPMGEAVRGTWPFLSAVWGHPATAMLLGALSKSWRRTQSRPAVTPEASADSAPLDFVLKQVRQHPKTAVLALGLVGLAATYWLSRQGPSPTPSKRA
ncbi:MAG: hypothetical protein RL297_1621 [Pseudomonadota bacterium]|jgi:hypothetical protein